MPYRLHIDVAFENEEDAKRISKEIIGMFQKGLTNDGRFKEWGIVPQARLVEDGKRNSKNLLLPPNENGHLQERKMPIEF